MFSFLMNDVLYVEANVNSDRIEVVAVCPCRSRNGDEQQENQKNYCMAIFSIRAGEFSI